MSATTPLKTLMTARAKPPKALARLARPVGIPLIVLSVIAIYGLVAGRIVLNSSDSLAARGFYVVVWPKPLIRGAVVVVDPPKTLSSQFEGLVFTKRLVGLPGDEIIHRDGALCLKDQCFARALKDGKPFGALTAPQIIPQGHVALFGETTTSLDSRYAAVGLFPTDSIRAVGVSIPGFPAWEDLKERIGS